MPCDEQLRVLWNINHQELFQIEIDKLKTPEVIWTTSKDYFLM